MSLDWDFLNGLEKYTIYQANRFNKNISQHSRDKHNKLFNNKYSLSKIKIINRISWVLGLEGKILKNNGLKLIICKSPNQKKILKIINPLKAITYR